MVLRGSSEPVEGACPLGETATVSETASRHTQDEIRQAIDSADAERAAAC